LDTHEKVVEYYQTADDRVPFREWLASLKDRGARARIRTRIDRLILGNLGHCAPVGHGVLELKIDYGPGYRVYFGQVGSTIVVLLCGGDKSTQHKDIATAHDYWEDYRRRDAEEKAKLSRGPH
jgi:putative addiction module killer protein